MTDNSIEKHYRKVSLGSAYYSQHFPCLESPEVRRALDLCDATANGKSYAEAVDYAFRERESSGPGASWSSRYAAELAANPEVATWFKSLQQEPRPGVDPRDTFEVAARAIYSLAGMTKPEADAALLAHQGESLIRIGRLLDKDRTTIRDALNNADRKLWVLGKTQDPHTPPPLYGGTP